MAEKRVYGQSEVLFADDKHQFIWLGAGNPADEDGIPSHQYLIVDGGEAHILDPGGHHIFERVHENVCKFVDPADIKTIFLSHQDPDVAAGIDLWLKVNPKIMVVMSGLWIRFLLHNALQEIPELLVLGDAGDTLELASGSKLHFVPAHFLHSPGNFHVYDERAKILFSGDVGAASSFVSEDVPVVTDMQDHKEAMIDFHRRYMACNKAVQNYLAHVDKLEIEMICPQHGAIFKGEHVAEFFSWLSGLDVGVDYSG